LLEVRWHGRGGQGVVTSSQLLTQAAIFEGKYAIHIPEFGPERRGAPVRAFTRIDDKPIEIRYGVINPDIVVVIDPSLVSYREMITEGLKPGGKIIVNKPVESAEKIGDFETYAVDAYRIAMDEFGRPIYNTPMIGALIGATKILSLESVIKAVRDRFGGEVAERNIRAIKRGFEEVRRVG
jgi:pyruvate ferredoxin oxidoreductase gamma subunit